MIAIIVGYGIYVDVIKKKKDKNEDEEQKIKIKKPATIVIIIVVLGFLLFCLSFHVVISRGIIFPKSHLSFEYTFITDDDIDQIITQFNHASFIERISIMNEPLHKKLHEEGILEWKNEQEENDERTARERAEAKFAEYERRQSEVVEITLKALLDSFSYKNDKEYSMNKKYVGQTLQVTGRTSGVDEEGILRLQLEPFDDVVKCFGISDAEFLSSVKENDIVSVTGTLGRSNGFLGKVCELRSCYDCKVIKKSKRKSSAD